jgi:hypothetical protein
MESCDSEGVNERETCSESPAQDMGRGHCGDGATGTAAVLSDRGFVVEASCAASVESSALTWLPFFLCFDRVLSALRSSFSRSRDLSFSRSRSRDLSRDLPASRSRDLSRDLPASRSRDFSSRLSSRSRELSFSRSRDLSFSFSLSRLSFRSRRAGECSTRKSGGAAAVADAEGTESTEDVAVTFDGDFISRSLYCNENKYRMRF